MKSFFVDFQYSIFLADVKHLPGLDLQKSIWRNISLTCKFFFVCGSTHTTTRFLATVCVCVCFHVLVFCDFTHMGVDQNELTTKNESANVSYDQIVGVFWHLIFET